MQKFLTLLFIVVNLISKADSWTQKANFGGTARQGISYFSIGNKGYMGIGTDSYPVYNFRNDFWEYNFTTDTWTQMANFAGPARYYTICFSIGNKGYVGTGWDQVTPFYNDFWEYDQPTNTWTQKNNFPGLARTGAIGFTINNIAYAGFGLNGNTLLNDFYVYNDTTDIWTQVAFCTGAGRCNLFGFGINGKGYIGTGMVSYPSYASVNDFWEYDPTLNVWTQKANFAGLPRFGAIGFELNNKGYAGLGNIITGGTVITFYNDFYEYNANANSWSQKSNMLIPGSFDGGFTIGNHGYIGCGDDSTLNLTNHFWEYTPDSTTSIQEISNNNLLANIFPNPFNDKLNVDARNTESEIILYDVAARKLLHQKFTNSVSLNTEQLARGLYLYEVRSRSGSCKKGKVVKD